MDGNKTIKAPRTYYVYTYAFPDGAVFYVGKGCNARIDEHEREARRGCACKKCRTIRLIWESGHPVQKRIAYETFKEHEALSYEDLLIQTYGLTNLTNIREGATYRTTDSTTNRTTGSTTTFRELRLQAGLSVNRLARLAFVSFQTVQRADEGLAIQYFKALALVETLSRELGKPLTLDDIDDLKITYQPGVPTR